MEDVRKKLEACRKKKEVIDTKNCICFFVKNKCHAHGVYPEYVIIYNYLIVLITCG